MHYTSISRGSTMSQTWTSVFKIQIAVLCPKLAHVKLIQFHRDDFSKMWPVQKVWRGFSHQLAVFNRNFGTPPTSTTLPKEGMSGAIHNKNQSISLFINPYHFHWCHLAKQNVLLCKTRHVHWCRGIFFSFYFDGWCYCVQCQWSQRMWPWKVTHRWGNCLHHW